MAPVPVLTTSAWRELRGNLIKLLLLMDEDEQSDRTEEVGARLLNDIASAVEATEDEKNDAGAELAEEIYPERVLGLAGLARGAAGVDQAELAASAIAAEGVLEREAAAAAAPDAAAALRERRPPPGRMEPVWRAPPPVADATPAPAVTVTPYTDDQGRDRELVFGDGTSLPALLASAGPEPAAPNLAHALDSATALHARLSSFSDTDMVQSRAHLQVLGGEVVAALVRARRDAEAVASAVAMVSALRRETVEAECRGLESGYEIGLSTALTSSAPDQDGPRRLGEAVERVRDTTNPYRWTSIRLAYTDHDGWLEARRSLGVALDALGADAPNRRGFVLVDSDGIGGTRPPGTPARDELALAAVRGYFPGLDAASAEERARWSGPDPTAREAWGRAVDAVVTALAPSCMVRKPSPATPTR